MTSNYEKELKGMSSFKIKLNPTTGAPIGKMGTDKLEGGLKKGSKGMPPIKKNK